MTTPAVFLQRFLSQAPNAIVGGQSILSRVWGSDRASKTSPSYADREVVPKHSAETPSDIADIHSQECQTIDNPDPVLGKYQTEAVPEGWLLPRNSLFPEFNIKSNADTVLISSSVPSLAVDGNIGIPDNGNFGFEFDFNAERLPNESERMVYDENRANPLDVDSIQVNESKTGDPSATLPSNSPIPFTPEYVPDRTVPRSDTVQIFRCLYPACGRTFDRQEAFESHEAKHQSPSSVGRHIIQCPREGCESTFTRSEKLEDHLVGFHEGRRPFKCPLPGCQAKFVRKQDCRRHHKTHFPADLYCPHCPRSFQRKYCFTKHIKARHSSATD